MTLPAGERQILRMRPGFLFVLVYRQGWWLGPPIALWLVHYALSRLWEPDPMPWAMSAGLLWLGVGLVWRVLAWLSRSYVLTDRRLLVRAGVLGRIAGDVPLARIQRTTMSQTLLERLLGLGTIGISTADGPAMNWLMVPGPERVVDEIRRATEACPRPVPAATSPQNQPLPRVIGLAGGIGAGKSEVARILRSLGCVVVDSDKEAKEALDRPEVRDQLVGWWGRSILRPDGRADRKAIADIIFKDPAQRRRLEGLVHPILRTHRAVLRRRSPGAAAIVIDAPLLFEAGVDAECDTVIFIDAPREVRLARVRAARGWDEAELTRRESSQMPLEEKRRRSARSISNTGNAAELADQVARILDSILKAR